MSGSTYLSIVELEQLAAGLLDGDQGKQTWATMNRAYMDQLPERDKVRYAEALADAWSTGFCLFKDNSHEPAAYLNLLRDVIDASSKSGSTYPIYTLDTHLSSKADAESEQEILEIFRDRIAEHNVTVRTAVRSLLIDILVQIANEKTG